MHRHLFFPLLILALLVSCQQIEDIKQTAKESAIEESIKLRLGESVDAKVSGKRVIIRKEEAEYIITIGRQSTSDNDDMTTRLPVFPGSELVSHIQGVKDETISFYAIGDINQIEKYFNQTLGNAEFSRKNVVRGNGQFNSIWVDKRNAETISIFAYSENDYARITLIVSLPS